MGHDKAFVQVNGRPMALRVADGMGEFCRSVALVGDPNTYLPLGLPVVADSFAGEGPLAGIEAALGFSDVDWNLIVACDMPGLNKELIDQLVAAVHEDDGDCVLPQYEDGKVEPLCALYHRRCHPAILEALKEGVRKVTDALQKLPAVRYVRVPLRSPLPNVNTPEDLLKYTNG